MLTTIQGKCLRLLSRKCQSIRIYFKDADGFVMKKHHTAFILIAAIMMPDAKCHLEEDLVVIDSRH